MEACSAEFGHAAKEGGQGEGLTGERLHLSEAVNPLCPKPRKKSS